MALEYLELALNACYELARSNGTLELYPDFWRFVTAHYQEFPGEYASNNHTRRNTTGQYEKTLVTLLIKMCTYKCTINNCQLASLVMSLLGYDSYRQMSHRFRQKVENFLRKERKEGGKVPPSTRTFPFFSNYYYDEYIAEEGEVYSRPTTRSQTNLMNSLKRNKLENVNSRGITSEKSLQENDQVGNDSIPQGGEEISSVDNTGKSFIIPSDSDSSNLRVC